MAEDRRRVVAVTRRGFIRGVSSAGVALAAAPAFVRGVHADAHYTDSELFPLGVHSGDPNWHSVVIGTRVAPDPLEGGGLTRPTEVWWEVATDPGLTNVVRRGFSLALPVFGGSVLEVVNGLRPDTWYYYRFQARGHSSRIGRTRTFPAPWQSPGSLRFALCSCQDYRAGFYAAYRDIAEQGVDCVIHVGDYIYENGSGGSSLRSTVPGSGPGGEILTIEDYRNRYAQYRLDEGLKAAHASAPFLMTWDDHEVDNNYADGIAEEGAPAQGEAFLERRRAAYQVYSEVMPLHPRSRMRRSSGRVDLFRTFEFGKLADIHMLDGRQFRSDQRCGDGIGPVCGEESDPAATMLGTTQRQRLFGAMRRSRATWNILAQQTMMTRWNIDAAFESPVPVINLDAWDGYQAARQAITEFISTWRPNNPVVLTGDIHSSFAANVLHDFDDPSTVVAAEIVGTSISSTFLEDPAERIGLKQITLARNPHILFHEGALRGYVLGEVTADEMLANYKGVLDVTDPGSPVIDVAQAVVVDGTPGLAGPPSVFADPDLGVLP